MNESETKMEFGESLIAHFGEARLVKGRRGLRLIGGSMADRMEALEWVSMFMPDEQTAVGE